jgi:uncharacterized protein YbaP (TraB family)
MVPLAMTRTRLVTALAAVLALFALPGVPALWGAPQDTQVITLPAPPPASPGSPAATTANTAPVYVPVKPVPAIGGSVNGLMWKATSPTTTVYLVGSIHLASADLYPLPQAMEDAFQKASVLVVEVDMTSVDSMKMLSVTASDGIYRNGDSLWNHVSERTKDLVTAFCTEHGLDPALFSRFKPWLATLTLSTMAMSRAGLKPEYGIDLHFLNKAKGVKRIEQLESANQQIRMLSQIPEAEAERGLAEAVENFDRLGRTANELKASWRRGDAGTLGVQLASEFQSSPGTEKKMFGERNPRMAAAVEQYLQGSEPIFVVVGAGHLVGKDGVVAILQRKGYKVTQVLSSK